MQHGNLEKRVFLSNRADFDLGDRKCARHASTLKLFSDQESVAVRGRL